MESRYLGTFGPDLNSEHESALIRTKSWNIIENTDLFCHTHDTEGRYCAKLHIAEMIALLGPPPKEFVTRSDASISKWPDPITNEAGKPCRSLHEFYGGPFFDTEGKSWNQSAGVIHDC